MKPYTEEQSMPPSYTPKIVYLDHEPAAPPANHSVSNAMAPYDTARRRHDILFYTETLLFVPTASSLMHDLRPTVPFSTIPHRNDIANRPCKTRARPAWCG